MVDYNNENTLATPSIDINRVQILERRAYVISALEQYYKNVMCGVKANDQELRSKIASLFWELQETLYRKFNKITDKQDDNNIMTYKDMINVIIPSFRKKPIEEYLQVWKQINILLGEINLTRIDTRKDYDSTNLEEENRVQNI